MPKTYLGIDIGTNELHLALFSGSNIRCLPAEPMPKNLIQDGRIISAETMAQVIRDALKKHKITAKACALVLPPELAFTRRISMPYMTSDQLDINLPYEFHDYIQKDKDTYFYDYAVLQVEEDENSGAKTMDLLAAAVEKETIQEYRRILSKARLRLDVAIPESFAYRNLIRYYEGLTEQEQPGEYCIVDLGHAAIRVHMFQGGSYETTRVIEYGGAALGGLIADQMDVDPHVAENYKITNYENVQELPPCRELYARIAVEILRAINFYRYNNPDSHLNDVYLCGGLTRINRLMQSIEDTLELRLHDIRELLPPFDEEENAERCPAAIGVTLQ